MMNKLPDKLEAEVRKILLQDWDPIGIKDEPGAEDEYDSYTSPVCRMLRAGQSKEDIYNYLRWVEVERIGLDGDESLTMSVTLKLKGLLE